MKQMKQDQFGVSNPWKKSAAHRILLTWQSMVIGYIIIVFAVGVPTFSSILSLTVAGGITSVCLRLNRTGHTQLAISISSTIYGLAVTFSVYMGGALDISGWMFFIPIILMVSLFINARTGIAVSLLAGLYITFLAWGMHIKIVPPLGYELAIGQKYAMSIMPLLLSAVEMFFIAQAMEEASSAAYTQKQIADQHAHNLEQANADLGKSEARFRTIVEDAADGIIVVNADGIILVTNQQLCSWLGYTRDELLARHIHQVDVSPNPPSHEFIIHIITEANKPYTFRTMYQRKDGSTFPADVHIVAIEFGQKPALLGMIRDVTAQEAAQAELETSLHEKELLLYEIHHRVKNNLQIVTSLVRMQERQSIEPEVIEASKSLQGRIRSMAIIHQQLYQTTALSSIDFSIYIRTLVKDIQHVYDNRYIRFEFELESVHLTVDNALTAGSIVNELVTNAIKHAFPDRNSGIVYCKLFSKQSIVTLIISDNGRGGEDIADKLSAKQTMGMQLLNMLTNQLKGSLTINHPPDHQGTQFTLTFSDPIPS